MPCDDLQVGELAKRTALTVRTLHHYDEIGLVNPSNHSHAGYRLYTRGDVARLQQVLSLRQLGFSLEEIRDCLDKPEYSPLEVVRLHLERLREHIDHTRNLASRLESIAEHFRSAEDVSTDEFLRTIEAMTMSDKYFTPAQLALIQSRRDEAGDELLREKQEDWAQLIAEIRVEMEAGTDPGEPRVQALAQRWTDLLRETTASDPAIEQSLRRLWQEQGDTLAAQFGAQYDPRPVAVYITTVIQAAKT
jgi:DNA-binding transcriptional MerR regulator